MSNLNLSGVRLDAAVEIFRVSHNLKMGQAEINTLTDQDGDIEGLDREPGRVYIEVNQIPNHQPSVVEMLANGEFNQ
jgi:hypothetical protein